MLVIGALLIVVGWCALTVASRTVRGRSCLRSLGTAALIVSPIAFVAAKGVEQGPVYWMAMLMICAIAVVVSVALLAPSGTKRKKRRAALTSPRSSV